MARIIWADPAIQDLDAIADYIALENPAAASGLVRRVFQTVHKLQKFPHMGSIPPELNSLPYRQLVIPPCRVFYRIEKRSVYIVHVVRGEQLVRKEIFETPTR
jgi:toxin ParE1/3/4